MKRTFVEFSRVREALEAAAVPAEARRQMELAIMRGEGDTIAGTGGLKKIRCAGSGRGKSGGVRVVFADYPEAGWTLLLAAYPKNVQANLTPSERAAMRQAKQTLDARIALRGAP